MIDEMIDEDLIKIRYTRKLTLHQSIQSKVTHVTKSKIGILDIQQHKLE